MSTVSTWAVFLLSLGIVGQPTCGNAALSLMLRRRLQLAVVVNLVEDQGHCRPSVSAAVIIKLSREWDAGGCVGECQSVISGRWFWLAEAIKSNEDWKCFPRPISVNLNGVSSEGPDSRSDADIRWKTTVW